MSLLATTTMADISGGREIMNNDKKGRIKEIRGSLMIVATVIAQLAFQIAINPPGGVWDSDKNPGKDGCPEKKYCRAGTSVLAFSDKDRYKWFMVLCTISFSASLSVVLFLVTLFPLIRHRLVKWIMIAAMCTSVICLAGAYVIAIWMVTNPIDPDDDKVFIRIIQYSAVFWGSLVVLLCVGFFHRSLFWLVKKR